MKKHDTQTTEMFRTVAPTMPEGYYSGDKPNPNLQAFIETWTAGKPTSDDDYELSNIQPSNMVLREWKMRAGATGPPNG